MMPQLILKQGREESLLRKHPWVFSGAVEKIFGEPEDGGTVDILSSRRDFLAKAAFSPHSQIRARVWSWDQDEEIGYAFFHHKIMAAVTARERYRKMFPAADGALRLVHGESDGLPGLIVDQYNTVVVIQFLTAGVEHWRNNIVDILSQLPGITAIFERSDADVRELEGLNSRTGCVWGAMPDSCLKIIEHGVSFSVDIQGGHKTGFYLDQRSNRRLVRCLAPACDVLDCFSYTGGFTINALVGGASSVVAIDSSENALDMLMGNVKLNNLPLDRLELVRGDVFRILRLFRDQSRSFDMIILDPPKFAHTTLLAQRASRGYKDINLLAFKLLRRGGTLMTFSCSGGISAEFFQKIIAGAALDAGVDARIVAYLHQDWDHPVALNFPEGAYLKGLVVSASS